MSLFVNPYLNSHKKKKMENKERKEQKQDKKNEENIEEEDDEKIEGEEEDEKIENIETSDDEFSYDENDNENEEEEDEDEDDDDDDDDENSSSDSANEKEILKSLIYLSQLKKKKEKKEKNEFLPPLKKFFKSSMTKRHELYNKNIKNKLCFLAKSIITKKIHVDHSPEYGYLLKKLAKKKMHSEDQKIAICEDYGLRGIFSKAIKIIEKSQKNVKSK